MGGLRFGLLKGLGVSLLLAITACGGRSSTLYPDAITDLAANQPSGGATGKPSTGGSGASPSVGTGGATASGGATSIGTAGAPAGGNTSGGTAGVAGSPSTGGAPAGGSAGLDSALLAGCKDYCSASSQGPCPIGFEAGQCMSSCTSEVTSRSAQCQMLIKSMLSCLTTVYDVGSSCDEVTQLSLAKCAPLLASNPSCFAPNSNPPPPPDPAPTCSSSGNSSNGTCNLDVKCTTGAYYTVSCYQTGTAQSSCTCNASLPNGAGTGASFGLNENATFACYDSLAACGFPQIGAK